MARGIVPRGVPPQGEHPLGSNSRGSRNLACHSEESSDEEPPPGLRGSFGLRPQDDMQESRVLSMDRRVSARVRVVAGVAARVVSGIVAARVIPGIVARVRRRHEHAARSLVAAQA